MMLVPHLPWETLVLCDEGMMAPFGLVGEPPECLPWVLVTVISPELARQWLAEGVYARNANLFVSICISAAEEQEPPVTVCGELPEFERPLVYGGPSLVLDADQGAVLAKGIKDLAGCAGVPCRDHLTPCVSLDLRGRVFAGSYVLQRWREPGICVVIVHDIRGSETRRCSQHRREDRRRDID
jgi:hypothetical protein